MLEQIFNTARNDGAAIRSPLQQHKAAGRTLQLFEEMEKAHGLARPTHSTKGCACRGETRSLVTRRYTIPSKRRVPVRHYPM